jgi:hypothetical protein
MDKIIWRLLMWMWVRQAKRSYCGPGERGELFNTACFQSAVLATTGTIPVSQTCDDWLRGCGLHAGHGECHWLRTKAAADATRVSA